MLYFFFWLEAALACGGIYLAVPTLHPAWILPITLGFFVALCLLFLLYLYLTPLLFRKGYPDHPVPYAAATVRIALAWFMRIFMVKITVKGKEKLPDGPVVYVCNHRSALDPVFVICGLKKRKMAFIAKESVMKYPVVGPHVRRAAFLGIDRDSPMQSLRAINRAAKYIREDGIDYGIFPEGTRSHDKTMLPFKSGAFLMAKKADVPIAVLTMQGSETAWSGLPFHRPRVLLRVEHIIPVEQVREKTHEELSDHARAIMENALEEK